MKRRPKPQPGKPPRASQTQLADLVLPSEANLYGTVFGGKILEMVDKAAAVCAMRHAGRPCVTVAMDRVEFLVPIRLGSLLSVEAKLQFAGRTSMEVGVEVYAEDIDRGRRVHANTCVVTMVAVDKAGRPVPVPPLLPETPEEQRRFADARRRRAQRTR